jgi:hypothetical protein
VLYPDIAAHGSLAAALRAEADRAELSVPFTDKTEYPLGALGAAAVASTLMHRAPLHIGAYTQTRRWSIRGTDSFLGYALIDGATGDLTEIARVAQAWHDGATLDDIRQAAAFVHLTGLLEVPDGDPARLIESKWQLIRTEARERNWPAHHALIEAAYAEPALRALYPFTSHTTLRFGSTIPRATPSSASSWMRTRGTPASTRSASGPWTRTPPDLRQPRQPQRRPRLFSLLIWA